MRQNPVAFLTTLVAVLTGLDGTLQGLHVLTATQSAVAAGLIALLTAVLGIVTHGKVTPTANPKDSSGRPLVPLSTGRQ
jgi:hypothetical protein